MGRRSYQDRLDGVMTKAEKKHELERIKLARGCKHCGYNKCARALHYHHRGDSGPKVFSISQAHLKDWNLILLEVCKCDVLCANCHAEYHSDS